MHALDALESLRLKQNSSRASASGASGLNGRSERTGRTGRTKRIQIPVARTKFTLASAFRVFNELKLDHLIFLFLLMINGREFMIFL